MYAEEESALIQIKLLISGILLQLAYLEEMIGGLLLKDLLKKKSSFQKNIYFCFIDYAKAFDCVAHDKLENSERDGNTKPPDLPLEKSVCRSKSNS